MPMPRFVARINKRLINKRALKKGEYPVITHTGRVSGKTFRTPLDAHAIENGFIFAPIYGAQSDWVQNVLAAGTATLTTDGKTIALDHPRLISEETARQLLPPDAKMPPGILHISEYLQMDEKR